MTITPVLYAQLKTPTRRWTALQVVSALRYYRQEVEATIDEPFETTSIAYVLYDVCRYLGLHPEDTKLVLGERTYSHIALEGLP